MKEPVDHILRPRLPWRTDAGITECRFDASKVRTLSREEFQTRLKDYGRQRTAMMTCMTCSDTARRWGTWEDDPRKAIEREVQWETSWRGNEHGERLRDDLIAIAALIEAHREEFEAHVERGVLQRAWVAQKAAMTKKPTPPRIRGGL